METNTLTGHVPTEYIRPATIHQKQPPRLHLTVKRRTKFNVQPRCTGSVDHKCLRSDDHRFPLRHWKVFTKTFGFYIFCLPFPGGAETGGACWTIFELKHYTRCTDDQHVIDVSPVSQGPGNPTPTILRRNRTVKKNPA